MSTLIVKTSKGVLDVRLNRPDKRNAIDAAMIQELTHTFTQLAQQAEPQGPQKSPPPAQQEAPPKANALEARVVLLSGVGKNFCAGADLNEMRATKNYSTAQNLEQARLLYNMFESLYSCPLPVVCQAHGFNAGGALGLMAACDVVALESASKLCFSEVRLGLVAAVISPFVMQKMQASMAQALISSGRVFSAKEALQSHLVHFVGRELEVNQFVRHTLEAYLQADPTAVAEVKKLCRQYYASWFSPERKQKAIELIARLRTSPAAQQRMGRFLDGKK